MSFDKDHIQKVLKDTHDSPVGMELDMRFEVAEFIEQQQRRALGWRKKSFAKYIGTTKKRLKAILRAEVDLTMKELATIYWALEGRPSIINKEKYD